MTSQLRDVVSGAPFARLAIRSAMYGCVSFALSCQPYNGSFVTVPTGFYPRTSGISATCQTSASVGWVESGATLGVMASDEAPRICGYVVRRDTNRVDLVVSIRVPCVEVGNNPSPSSGNCNDGGSSTTNRIALWDDVLGQQASEEGYQMTLDDGGDEDYFVSSIHYPNHRSTSTEPGDFVARVVIRFNRRGPNAVTATYVVLGEVESQGKSVSGPTSLDATETGTWRVTTGSYSAKLYRIAWYIDGALQSEADSTISRAFATPGTRQLIARVTLRDGAVDTVTTSVSPLLHAGIYGPASITSVGTETWDAQPTGVTGVSYVWQKVDDGTGQTTSLGTSSSASVTIDANSLSFTISVIISKSGWSTVSAIRHVDVSVGGLEQLNIPARRLPAAKRRGPRLN